MKYKKGEIVSYPNFGVCLIDEVEILNEGKQYYKLKSYGSDTCRISVEVEKAENNGLRKIVSARTASKALKVFENDSVERELPKKYHERIRYLIKNLKDNNIIEITETINVLNKVKPSRTLGLDEKMYLDKAKQIVISELAVANKMDKEKIGIILHKSNCVKNIKVLQMIERLNELEEKYMNKSKEFAQI